MFNFKKPGRKKGGKNPNAGRKPKNSQSLPQGQSVLCFAQDFTDSATSDFRNDTSNSNDERTSAELPRTPLEEPAEVDELASIRGLLEVDSNTSNNIDTTGDDDDDETEEADTPIPEEDEREGEDQDSILEK
ncbi:hypothetical protein BDB00DRAFT_788279 [Zychaea mexicana]|uniref:uncharacterized protein n=1 Tax=Zychaea mexicana TaxID=64656 RepID=UPI0022FE4EEA|nr:uncharacterized protein BDB00DRAFT_788279 [Zychaea mexicana]KAI9493049.1 hypothetical protein BDB00DRAFT_788279 [Zychaea mexicana]